MKRHLKAIAALGGAATLLGALALPASADTNNVPDPIYLGGSDTTYGVMSALGALYGSALGCNQIVVSPAVQPLDDSCVRTDGTTWLAGDYTTAMKKSNASHDYVVSRGPIGSSNGIKQVDKQGTVGVSYVDAARSSRARRLPPGPPTADNVAERWVAYASEALTWVAAKTQSLPTNLTQAQISNIFTGCAVDGFGNPIQPPANDWINDWSLAGGPVRPITLYTAQAGSGTRSQWDTFVGGDSSKCIPAAFKDGGADDHVVFENDPAPIFANGDQSTAIFYYSGGRYVENKETRVYQGSINGIAPTLANAANFSFPFTRYVWNVYRQGYVSGNAAQYVRDFLGVKDATTGEMGFLCQSTAGGLNQSAIDPATGKRYAALTKTTMSAHGFAQLTNSFTDVDGDLGIPNKSTCRVEN